MKIKKIGAAVVVIAMAYWFCACGEAKKPPAEKIYAGIACYNRSDIFVNKLVDCLREGFDGLNSEKCRTAVSVRDAAGSQRTQDDQVKELLDSGCNILCVNLVDRADPSDIIDLARERGVPIIFFNREPVAEDLMQWDRLYYVGADAAQAGAMQGELAADAIQEYRRIDRNKDGKIQYVVLEGEPGHQDTIIRTESAVDALKREGIELEKLGCGIANWSRAQAQNRMLQMLSLHQNKIELVLANNDEMALGALDAYAKLNYTESALPAFFGVDGTDAGLKAVKEGKLFATVYNNKEGQAQAMIKLAKALVTQKRMDMDKIKLEKNKYIYLEYAKVTRGNIWAFLKEEE